MFFHRTWCVFRCRLRNINDTHSKLRSASWRSPAIVLAKLLIRSLELHQRLLRKWLLLTNEARWNLRLFYSASWRDDRDDPTDRRDRISVVRRRAKQAHRIMDRERNAQIAARSRDRASLRGELRRAHSDQGVSRSWKERSSTRTHRHGPSCPNEPFESDAYWRRKVFRLRNLRHEVRHCADVRSSAVHDRNGNDAISSYHDTAVVWRRGRKLHGARACWTRS